MELPKIENVMKDARREVTYRIMAYRHLSHDEMITAIRAAHTMKPWMQRRRNYTFTILRTAVDC